MYIVKIIAPNAVMAYDLFEKLSKQLSIYAKTLDQPLRIDFIVGDDKK